MTTSVASLDLLRAMNVKQGELRYNPDTGTWRPAKYTEQDARHWFSTDSGKLAVIHFLEETPAHYECFISKPKLMGFTVPDDISGTIIIQLTKKSKAQEFHWGDAARESKEHSDDAWRTTGYNDNADIYCKSKDEARLAAAMWVCEQMKGEKDESKKYL